MDTGTPAIAIPVKVSVKFGAKEPILQDAILRPITTEGGKMEWHYFLVNR